LAPKEIEERKTELCRVLHKIGSLKFGVFKLTSGRTSPYYIDLRIVPSFPDAFQRVCDVYVNLIKKEIGKEGFDRIAGIPTAGIPFASLIAYQLGKPFLYIRQLPRLHGTGRSLRKAAKAIRAEGGLVNHALVLLDREEGGKQRLAEDNINLHFLLTASEAAKKLHEAGAIDNEQLKTILKQVKK